LTFIIWVQRVVGAALEYAEDPMEVSKLDVLHVLRKNKRFLTRVVTTYDHLEAFKRNKERPDGVGLCNQAEKRLDVLATFNFDQSNAPPRGEEEAPVASTRQDFSDAAREGTSETSAGTRISFKIRKTA
jgi:hypothetical protein